MSSEKKDLLFITRKFPPQTGGMENLSYNLFIGLQKKVKQLKLVRLGKKQIHLLWFFPYTVFYSAFCAHRYRTLLLGDGLLCFLGVVSKLFAPQTKRVIILHGLDLLFDNWLYQSYLKLFFRQSADLFICDSTETERVAREKGARNTLVVTPGIDVEQFTGRSEENARRFRRENGLPESRLVIITVGRLVKRKGVAWFVENVLPQLDDVDWVYYIIGDGEDRAVIQDAIERNRLSDRVYLLGRIPDTQLQELYSCADIFVMPNIKVENDMEGFGIVALEASLSGLIILASGIEGILDAVIDGQNGYLVESANAEAFCSKIRELNASLPAYTEKRAQFAAYTREHYSWDYICDRYSEAFSRLGEQLNKGE